MHTRGWVGVVVARHLHPSWATDQHEIHTLGRGARGAGALHRRDGWGVGKHVL